MASAFIEIAGAKTNWRTALNDYFTDMEKKQCLRYDEHEETAARIATVRGDAHIVRITA